jgi:hypothetical protein
MNRFLYSNKVPIRIQNGSKDHIINGNPNKNTLSVLYDVPNSTSKYPIQQEQVKNGDWTKQMIDIS